MADWTSLNYVVVDVEGNGQQPPDLVELAVVPIVGGVIGEPSSWLVRPDKPITPFARKIHGITNDQLVDAPVFGDIEDEVLRALDGAALIAHNALVTARLFIRLATSTDESPLSLEELRDQPSGGNGDEASALF